MNKVFRRFSVAAGLIGMTMATAWAADKTSIEEQIKNKANAFFGADAVQDVRPVPYGGLYEVLLKSNEIIYTGKDFSFFLSGSLIDVTKKENVTAKRMDEVMKIDFSVLPLDQAIKIVHGDGSRVIATFEDPNCTYCKKFTQELRGLDNATIYVFLYPVLGPDSEEKAKRIWCAPDRAQAYVSWMVENVLPPESTDCDTSVIGKNVELGKRLNVSGTPTTFLSTGRRIQGLVPLSRIEEILKEAQKK